MITHDLTLASEYGDYFVGIAKDVVLQGNRNEFFSKENLEKIFGLTFNVEFENEKIYLKISD